MGSAAVQLCLYFVFLSFDFWVNAVLSLTSVLYIFFIVVPQVNGEPRVKYDTEFRLIG